MAIYEPRGAAYAAGYADGQRDRDAALEKAQLRYGHTPNVLRLAGDAS